MDDASFLAAIAAAPEDAALRQVYADWLEDRGDERAEFVRACEALESLPAWDERRAELRPRWRELRARQSTEWLEATGYWPVYRPLLGEIPAERPLRWNLAREFIETWLEIPVGPPSSAAAPAPRRRTRRGRLNVPEPPAAQSEWDALFGHVYSLAAPHHRSLHGTPATERADDPPVAHSMPRQECESTSEYLLFTLVRRSLSRASVQLETRLHRDSPYWLELATKFSYTGLQMQGPVSGAIRLAEGPDLITMDYRQRQTIGVEQTLYVYAKSERALAQLSPELRSLLRPG